MYFPHAGEGVTCVSSNAVGAMPDILTWVGSRFDGVRPPTTH